MISGEIDLPTVYLRAGEIYFTDEPAVVITVLGSCVSVTLFHRHLRLSAISHGLLPQCRHRRGCDRSCPTSAKFVECSLRIMVDRFKQSGVTLRELEARVYGGADMFGARSPARFSVSVGKQNIETAKVVLEREGVRVFTMDVGGSKGRKIYFNTQTGEVLLQHLQPGVVLADNGDNGKMKG